MSKLLRFTVLLFWLGFSMLIHPATAQYQLQLAFKIDTPAVFISTDNLDNIYVVTQRNQLLKYNPSGKLLWNYSNKAFGKLGYVNATDPMRVLLFYPAIQQVVVLNNNLNEITRFNFGQDASRLISLVATANSNGYWIYDQANQQLQRLGNQFESELSSGNIYQLTNLALQPTVIQASDQFVYLFDPKFGIFQFDRFGNFLNLIKTESDNFQVKNNEIYFFRNNEWDCYKIASSEKIRLYTFDEKVLQASEGSKLLATLSNEGVKVYSIINRDEKK